MIGMMNIGSHESVEVYGSSRPSSIYDRNRISKDTRTYMEDGRVMLNGVPVRTATSDELWASMIRKMALRNMVIVEEKAGPLTKMFRRVSSKFRNTRKPRKTGKRDKASKKSKEQDLVIEQEQNDSDHITRIEILHSCNTMMPVFSLLDLPVALVVRVLQKMTPTSFVRLRRTCKTLDTIAEKHRKFIGILLDEIDLFPCFEYYCKRNIGVPFTSPEQILFHIWVKRRDRIRNGDHIHMSLAEAHRKLSGFTFYRVMCCSCTSRSATTYMAPHVLSEFMDFLRLQKWSPQAAASSFTPLEILNIIKPNILQIWDRNTSVRTIEIGIITENRKLPQIKDIPSHVDNFLVYPLYQFADEYIVTSAVRQIAKAFYDDNLSVSFVHLKRLQIEGETIEKMEIPRDNTAASTILKRYLADTPYEGNEIVAFDKIVSRPPPPADYSGFPLGFRPPKPPNTYNLLTTANTVLISRSGKKGLLAIGIEVFERSSSLMEVSVYFWNDRLEYLEATEEYIEKPSSHMY